eukprot:1672586-Pleurochrysis_carterae.AAC.1
MRQLRRRKGAGARAWKAAGPLLVMLRCTSTDTFKPPRKLDRRHNQSAVRRRRDTRQSDYERMVEQ